MKIKEGDQLPDAKIFILDSSPKETSLRQIWTNFRITLGHL